MPFRRKPLVRLSLTSLFIALLLTYTNYFNLPEAVHAARLDEPQVQRHDKLPAHLKGNQYQPDETITVIVTLNGSRSDGLNAFLAKNAIHKRREMKNLDSFSLSLPCRLIAELASFPEVAHVSSNEAVHTMGHVTSTTGAETGQTAALAAGRGLIDGSGVGLAILDSGIDVNHAQFSQAGGGSRVLAAVDFTGENRTDDPYGHGTFVAAAAAGGAGAGAAYAGIAPGVSLLNVRVLNSNGQGTVESVLAGLEWVAAHARQYNIRIVNLSLGTPAVESYKYDVLCRAVRGLVNSGIAGVCGCRQRWKRQRRPKNLWRHSLAR